MEDTQGRPAAGKLTHEIDGDVLIIHQNGVADGAEIVRGLSQALADPALEAGSHLLWVAVDAPASASADKMRQLLAATNGIRSKLSSRFAMLVANDLQFGVSRMFAVFSEDFGLEVDIFYDIDEAKAWLRRKEGAAD